jgi:hypothetical protein
MITVFLTDGTPISLEESDKDLFILLTGATEINNVQVVGKSPVVNSKPLEVLSEGNQSSELSSPPVMATSAVLDPSKDNTVETNLENTSEV